MIEEIKDDSGSGSLPFGKQTISGCFWSQTDAKRWDRSDGAAVKYAEADNYMYAKPWLDGHRGWMAYAPDKEFPLSYRTKNGFNVAIKYKSAESAMATIDRLFQNSH